MDGDPDVFGDESVRILSSPGHTPGHCSLLVRLGGTGPVLLSADVAHYRFNLEHRCVPTMNSNVEESRSSMERIEAIARSEDAQPWINHDVVQTATIPHAPAYFDRGDVVRVKTPERGFCTARIESRGSFPVRSDPNPASSCGYV